MKLNPTHETAPQAQTGAYAYGPRLVAVVREGDTVRVQTQAQLNTGANAPFVILSDETMPANLFDQFVLPGLKPL